MKNETFRWLYQVPGKKKINILILTVLREASEKMADHKEARMKRNYFSNICNIGFAGAMQGMYLLGIGYCAMGILKGTISYGTLTAVMQLIGQIQTPFANITGYLPRFYAMTASAERLMEAEAYPDDLEGPAYTKEQIADYYRNSFRKLGLKNVDFTYSSSDSEENTSEVIRNLSLEIRKGEYIAFTGDSGRGKSTVMKLLMCMYSPDSGERYDPRSSFLWKCR